MHFVRMNLYLVSASLLGPFLRKLVLVFDSMS